MNTEIIHFNPHDAENGDFYPFVRINGTFHRVQNFRKLILPGAVTFFFVGFLTYPVETVGVWNQNGNAITTDGSILKFSEFTLYLIKNERTENPAPVPTSKHTQHPGPLCKYWRAFQNRIYKLLNKS